MSDGAAVLLQKAMITALKADQSLVALLGKDGDGNVPIYDTVSATLMQAAKLGKVPTYMIIGQGSETWDDAGEIESSVDGCFSEITKHEPTIAAFSQAGGFAAVKNIVAAARLAMTSAYKAKTFSLTGHQIIAFNPARAEWSRSDQDGITSIGTLTMRISTQPLT